MPEAMVRYTVQAQNPGAHLWSVQMEIIQPDPEVQALEFPAWIPGSYLMREFARNVSKLSARDDNGPIELEQEGRNRWLVKGSKGNLRLDYEVYAWDLSVRTSHLDQTHGYFNGTALFMMAKGLHEQPHLVELKPPEDPLRTQWRVATTLPRQSGDKWAFGQFQAADYDELIDHPVEMGEFDDFGFEANGIPHDVVITGRHDTDISKLKEDLTHICETELNFFGGKSPIDRFLFLVMVVGEGYGGLEHRASTSLLTRRSDLPAHGELESTEGYRNFLGLCSHEYFHLWNVKRIRPAAFIPFDLSQEAHTTLLWAFEGITSYYDDLLLLHAGRITLEHYLELIGKNFTRVYRGKGRLKQTLADSSYNAWTKFYRQDENAPNSLVSYYKKGALVAMALDLEIRKATDNQASLDDVMQRLWVEHGQPGIGVPEDGVERICSEVAQTDLSAFFDQAIRSTEDLDFTGILAHFGIQLKFRAADSNEDIGGRKGKLNDKQLKARGALGARISGTKWGVKLTHVLDDGSAQNGGLSSGDVIVAVEGLRATVKNLQRRLKFWKPGTKIKVHFFRRDELMERTLTLQAPAQDTVWLELDPEAEDAVIARRNAWLKPSATTP